MNDHPRTHLVDSLQLRDLPPYAKVFVGMFAALMLAVCLWAVWIFYEEKGKPDQANLPAYLQNEQGEKRDIKVSELPPDVRQDINTIWQDTAAVLAPEWDSAHGGKEKPIDSSDVIAIAESALAQEERARRGDTLTIAAETEEDEKFEDNLGLAHTHINGQSLLFFAIGLVFLFTSASAKVKKVIYWLFGISIILHVIGLTGEGYHWVYDDLLAVSGVLMLVLIVYMVFLIFVDLAKSPREING